MEWLQFWHWFALGLLLVIAESLGAAGLLVALGMAAGVTGLISLTGINWQWQLAVFAVLCILSAFFWWQFQKRSPKEPDTQHLNRPLEALVGRISFLSDPIINGRGKIYINDTYWPVTGPELAKGSNVKVIAVVDGTVLLVEAI